jgi:hypothetical protein
LDLVEGVAAVDQDAQVAGEGGRVTRDVHQARRFLLEQGVQDGRVGADAGRVEDHGVGALI